MTGRNVEPVSRERPPEDAPERETLTGLLDFLRATVVNKVPGLSDEEAFSAPVPPSTFTPAGIVKHLAGVERFWFSIDFAGEDLPWPWPDDDQHGAFAIDPGHPLAGLAESYLEECERSRKVVADAAPDRSGSRHRHGLHLAIRPRAHDRGDRPPLRPPGPASRTRRRTHG